MWRKVIVLFFGLIVNEVELCWAKDLKNTKQGMIVVIILVIYTRNNFIFYTVLQVLIGKIYLMIEHKEINSKFNLKNLKDTEL